MLKVSHIFSILIIIITAAIIVPVFFDMAFAKKTNYPYIQYSPIIDSFVILQRQKNYEMHYSDEHGNTYTKKEHRALLPFIYYTDLVKWNRLPSRIKGEKVTLETIKKNTQRFKIEPKDFNSPAIDIYPLFESDSMYSQLELPDSMFRINTQIEFIDLHTNTIKHEKSKLFTKALKEKGFTFPHKYIAGNPTTHKPFDEGYFLVDNTNTLFHLKMVKSQPLVKNTGITFERDIIHLAISENLRKEFYGYVITGNNKLCLISYNNYRLTPLPLEGYDPAKMPLTFQADLLYRTIIYRYYGSVTKDKDRILTHCVLLDKNFTLLKHYKHRISKNKISPFLLWLRRFVCPFTVSVSSSTTQYVSFNLNIQWWYAPFGSVTLMILYVLYTIKKSVPLRRRWLELFVLCLTGFYGLIAVLIMAGKENTGPGNEST